MILGTLMKLTLISMDKNAHIGTTLVIIDPVHFFQNEMQMCTASSQLLLACFPT